MKDKNGAIVVYDRLFSKSGDLFIHSRNNTETTSKFEPMLVAKRAYYMSTRLQQLHVKISTVAAGNFILYDNILLTSTFFSAGQKRI